MAFAPEDEVGLNLMSGWNQRWVYVVDATDEGIPEDPAVLLEEESARAAFKAASRRVGGRVPRFQDGNCDATGGLQETVLAPKGGRVDLWRVARPVACGGVVFVVQNRGGKAHAPLVFGDLPTATRHYQNAVSFEMGCRANEIRGPKPGDSWACDGSERTGRKVWFWSTRVMRAEVPAVVAPWSRDRLDGVLKVS